MAVEREDALQRLTTLVGADLRPLADEYRITVRLNGSKNKGWAGQTIERFLGLALNSAQLPDFGSWELKVIPLVATRTDALRVKETMAITMIDPSDVSEKSFEQSHLFEKLQKIIVVARIFQSQQESGSLVHSVATFDLDNEKIYQQVKADYELVRRTIQIEGFDSLTGKMGILVQPRTKGAGHGSTSRAFYARTSFVAHILGKGYSIPLPIQPEAL